MFNDFIKSLIGRFTYLMFGVSKFKLISILPSEITP